MEQKKVSDSLTEQVYIVRSQHINGYGRLFGGILMQWIDELAGIVDGRADHVEDRAHVKEGERCDAALLGGALALSGFRLQVFFSNPIAGPCVLGLSSGAKLAVEVQKLKNFVPAEEYHQKYLDKNPGGYCHIPSGYFSLKQE